MTIRTRCLCGATTLAIEGEPLEQFFCHCDDCQAVSGGAYVGVALYPAQAVKVEGKVETWTYRTLPRKRCAVCGTQLTGEASQYEQVGVKANLLPAGEFEPQFHIHCRYALMPVKDDLPHYRALPAKWGGSDEMAGW